MTNNVESKGKTLVGRNSTASSESLGCLARFLFFFFLGFLTGSDSFCGGPALHSSVSMATLASSGEISTSFVVFSTSV